VILIGQQLRLLREK